MHNWEHYNRLPAYLLMAALVASCGGGGSGGNNTGGLDIHGQSTATIQLATPSVAVALNGAAVVAVTLTESDNKTPIVGKQLTLSVSGSTVKLTTPTVTDANGKATFVLQGGGVAESGTIVVTYTDANNNRATAPTPLKYSVVDGTGQTSTSFLTLDTSTVFKDRIPRAGNTQSTATFVLRDGSGAPVANATVGFSLLSAVASTGRLSAATGQTDANGKVSVTIDGLNQTVGSNQLGVTYTDNLGAKASLAVPFSIVDSYEVLLSAATDVLKTGQDSVVLTARVLDASNALIPNAKVSFQIVKAEPKDGAEPEGTCSSDTSNTTVFGAALPVSRIGTLTANSVVTDANGQAKVTFEEFDNKNSTRRIIATVDADGLVSKPVACVDLTLQGTTLALDPVIVNAKSGDKVNFTASVKNARGVGVKGATVDFLGGSTLTPSSLQAVTNSNGQVQGAFTVSGNASLSAKVDSLNIVPVNVTAAQVAVSDLQVLVDFVAGGVSKTTLPINTPSTIKITAKDKGPIQGKVKLSTTLGSLQQSALTLDANGEASTTIGSVFPGNARIDVVITKDTGERVVGLGAVNFVSTTPKLMTLQSPVSTLKPAEQTEIQAEVMDDNNNPVEGAKVDFNIISDSSRGVLSSSYAFTDANGKAGITYTAGNADTALDGVQISAKILDDNGNQLVTSKAPVKLTVGGQALFVSIATGNEISDMPGDAGITNYALPMSVTVVDAAGHAVRDQLVSLDVIPTSYIKGIYVFDDLNSKRWYTASAAPTDPNTGVVIPGLVVGPYACANEDFDNDGFLDAGEDINGDNILWPGNPVTVPQTVRTDENGRATFNMQYGKNFGNWLRVKFVASVKVSGSESKSFTNFTLPIAAADLSSDKVTPPGGAVSYFGRPTVIVTVDADNKPTSAVISGNPCTLKIDQGGIIVTK